MEIARAVRKHIPQSATGTLKGARGAALVIHIPITPDVRVLGMEEATRDSFALCSEGPPRQGHSYR